MKPQRKDRLNKREKRAFVRIISATTLLCLLLLGFAPGCSLRSCLIAKQKREALLQENRRLVVESVQLKEEIRLLEQDKGYIEKVAREKYGMLRPDEEVYLFDPEPEKRKP